MRSMSCSLQLVAVIEASCLARVLLVKVQRLASDALVQIHHIVHHRFKVRRCIVACSRVVKHT